MPQIFDVTANENARYKRNELELMLYKAICLKTSGNTEDRKYARNRLVCSI